ncbi:amidase family protein [Paraburkholderia sp. BCC1884]|uniref:amidase family protein n=1 Tax=Paraburkholderia sp. BCC1884 TaxID=2562668 RepID=UPI0011843A01|nr:amidase family protein [Paraburkholderia sp. BCC1884]
MGHTFDKDGVSLTAVERAESASVDCVDIGQILLRTRFAAARAEAIASDTLFRAGIGLALAGLTLAAKACFDVRGWVTDAASGVLAHEPSAAADAPVVAALRKAGASLVGHANMTEFAFGALGINTTTGTPRTPLDTCRERVAGGSTSGGAVAVAIGLADIALGTDTSGSVRIPAAFCGLTGFKPSKGVLSEKGCIPLSTSFDSPGFITRDVSTMQRVVEALQLYGQRMVSEHKDVPRAQLLSGISFAVPGNFALQRSDDAVARAFERAVEKLRQCGANIVERVFTDLTTPSRIAAESGIIVADAYAYHGKWIHERFAKYDPLVGPRILAGQDVSAHRYIEGKTALRSFAHTFDEEIADYDALLTPTVPIIPPRVDDIVEKDEYLRINALVFSLTELANRVDVPSIALPFGALDAGPFGLMLTGRRRDDAHLLSISRRVEHALA